jgi:type I restriction enzyme, R subunit
VNYEDISLEKLSIYLRHLAPVIAESQLNHEIDLSTVDFDYIAQHKQETTSGKLSGDVPLQPTKDSGTGTAHGPEMVALDEVIAQINDLFSGDHPDSSVRNLSPTSRTGWKKARSCSSRRRTTRCRSSRPVPTYTTSSSVR